MIADLEKELDFVEITHSEAIKTIVEAGPLGVRGARIHDLLHATAARKYGADLLFTLDTGGFQGLTGIEIRKP